MLECIRIEPPQDKTTIKNILSDVFRELNVHYFDQFDTWKIENEELLDNNSICFSFIKNKSEFPIKLELTRTPEENTNDRELFLAKIISERLQCKTITNYRPHDAPKHYPYDSIIFDKGLAYLTDDSNSIWADGEGGAVQILKQIVFNTSCFDNRGRLITGSS